METSASFEARSAPSSYPTSNEAMLTAGPLSCPCRISHSEPWFSNGALEFKPVKNSVVMDCPSPSLAGTHIPLWPR